MKSYSLGVAIPSYNNALFLTECIESIVNQTYKNIKIIVVDDCSTDDSLLLLKKLSFKYHNLEYVVNYENSGVSYTRDRALRLLDTEYVTSIDSDDFYYSKYKIENELNLIKKYDSKGKDIVAYSNIVIVDEDGRFIRRAINDNNVGIGYCYEQMITRAIRIPTCSIFSKKLFERSGGFDKTIKMYEDWDFKIRLSKIAEFYYTNLDGFAYRQHGSGLSSQSRQIHLDWIDQVFEKNSHDFNNRAKLKRKLFRNVKPYFIQKIINKIRRLFPK